MATVKSSSNWNVSTINKFFNTILNINKNTETITTDNSDIKSELSDISTNTENLIDIKTDISQVSTNTEGISEIEVSTNTLAGSNGFVRHGASIVSGVSYKALVVQEETVFSEFYVNNIDVLAARGMSGVTFFQGAYLPGGANNITGFTITSGSVIGY
jgi:hypothetical protein